MQARAWSERATWVAASPKSWRWRDIRSRWPTSTPTPPGWPANGSSPRRGDYEATGLFPAGATELFTENVTAACKSMEAAVADVDYVTEAVPEDPQAKVATLQRISRHTPPEARNRRHQDLRYPDRGSRR